MFRAHRKFGLYSVDMKYFAVRLDEAKAFFNVHGEPLVLTCYVDSVVDRIWFCERDLDRHFGFSERAILRTAREFQSVRWNRHRDVIHTFRVVSLGILLFKLTTYYANDTTEADIFELYAALHRRSTSTERSSPHHTKLNELEDANVTAHPTTQMRLNHMELFAFAVIPDRGPPMFSIPLPNGVTVLAKDITDAKYVTGTMIMFTRKKISDFRSCFVDYPKSLTNEEAGKTSDRYLPSLVSLSFTKCFATNIVELFRSPLFPTTFRRTLEEINALFIDRNRKHLSRLPKCTNDRSNQEDTNGARTSANDIIERAQANGMKLIGFREGSSPMQPRFVFVNSFDFNEFATEIEIARNDCTTWWQSFEKAVWTHNAYHLQKKHSFLTFFYGPV